MLQATEWPAPPQESPLWKSDAVGPVELTSRQKAVLTELAKGISNREIGRALGISEITVKIHVHSICQKLAVRNRMQAVQRGRSLGLLPQ
jgi:ATP/maltotriose-dependent transcriptional regulator MalT